MSLLTKLQALFRKDQLSADMAEEMRLHLELQTERHIAAGMSADEARYAARREFGGVEQIKEQCRDQRGWRWLDELGQDLRYALRALRKNPAFTATAVLTLAIGIGVNTTILSFINDLILRPLLRDRSANLVAVHNVHVGASRSIRRFTYAEYKLVREHGSMFADVAAMHFNSSAVGTEQEAQRRTLCLVSENYFSVLNVTPLRGRFFSGEETKPGAGIPVAVASYPFWQAMGAREDFIGSQVQINGHPFTIIGITPHGFGGLQWSLGPYAWLPLGVSSTLVGNWGNSVNGDLLDSRTFRLELFGQLRSGLSIARAAPELNSLSVQLNAESHGGSNDTRSLMLTLPSRFNISITPPPQHEDVVNIYAAAALGITVTVLLVACLNVANMLLSRGVSRQKEIAIRLSLGASRWRVVRQLLVEGLLLAFCGGTLGLLLSRWGNDAMLHQATHHGGHHGGPLVLHLRTTFDWPLLVGTFTLSLVATLIFSLLPALRATKINVVEDLKRQPGEPGGAARWARFFSFRHCVVMAQIALSLMLVFCTGLLLRGVLDLEKGRGFETENQIVANQDYFLAGLSEKEMLPRQRALLERAKTLPGVTTAALASTVPFGGDMHWRRIIPVNAAGGPLVSDQQAEAQGYNGVYTKVSQGYFDTLGIPLLRGRDFTAGEAMEGRGAKVLIIDESLGRALFGKEDPIGQHVLLDRGDGDGQLTMRQLEIVGIVRSPREHAYQGAEPIRRIYRPIGQSGTANTYLHVKLSHSTGMAAVIETLRREMRALDPRTPILLCESLAGFIGSNVDLWTVRFLTGMFTGFGCIAVVLAVVGIYSVKSYIVARRTQEIGIRMALGARSADVLAMIFKQGVWQTLAGVVVGLSLGVIAGQFLSKLLYQVDPLDASAMVGATCLVALVSLIACLAPAIRATRINAAVALRAE